MTHHAQERRFSSGGAIYHRRGDLPQERRLTTARRFTRRGDLPPERFTTARRVTSGEEINLEGTKKMFTGKGMLAKFRAEKSRHR